MEIMRGHIASLALQNSSGHGWGEWAAGMEERTLGQQSRTAAGEQLLLTCARAACDARVGPTTEHMMTGP